MNRSTPVLAAIIMISLFPFIANADTAVDIEGEYALSKKMAHSRQKEIEKVFADVLVSELALKLGVSFKTNTELKEPVTTKIDLIGSTLLHQVDGIPFKLSAEITRSKGLNGLTKGMLECSVLYPNSDEEKRNAFYKKVLSFPEKYPTWNDFLARKADKYEIRKRSSGQNGEITAIEIISTDPGAGYNRLPLLESEVVGKTSSSMFLDGVDITGDDATINSNKPAPTNKGSGFLKGVGEFFRQQNGEKKQAPTGPQPGDGPVVSIKTTQTGAKDQAFCPAIKLFFIQPGNPQVQIEFEATLKVYGSKNDSDLVRKNLETIEQIAGQIFQQSREAILRASIIRRSKTKENEEEKPPVITDASDDQKTITDKVSVTKPRQEPLSPTAKRILELQDKLQKLVPDYIPDNPTLSDSETFTKIMEKFSDKTLEQIESENQEIEKAMVDSADGTGLGIAAITTPADESIGPGENFKLSIKVLSKASLNGITAFSLAAYDPWTGKELGRKIAKIDRREKIVELQLKAPSAGEATRKLDLEVVLEPLIGADAVPKRVSFILRGELNDGDILNRVRTKIFSQAAELRMAGYGISSQEREKIFENWQNSVWKEPGHKADFLKTFKDSPGDALARLSSFVEPQGIRILEAKLSAQNEKTNKEAQEQEKLSRLIKFYNLETSAYKRNAVIDYRMDPGYSLIDVLEDHVSYDPATGEVIGNLDEARQAIVEEHWELMKTTMSAADRYALEAGDDGLPIITKESPDKMLDGLSKIKDGTDYISKALDLVKYYQQFEVLDAGQAKNLAKMLHRLARTISETSSLVGESAGPLAKALREYEGFFANAAKLSNQLKSDLKVSDIPGTLGSMAQTMGDFAGQITSRFNDYKKAVNGLTETGKTAFLVKNLKKVVNGLGNVISRSLELGNSSCRGLLKFADTVIESGMKGSGKAAVKALDAGQDASNWLNAKLINAGDEMVDLGKTANDVTKGQGFVGKLLQGIKNKAAGNEKLINGIGHGIDVANLVVEYNLYRDAGQSEAEALSRSAISAGIEKFVGSKYSPLGLINFGLTKTMDLASSTLGLNQAFEEKFNMKTNQVNFSTPVKIMANQTVNQVMDFYNSCVVPGQRLEKAKINEDKIAALTIAAENCLQMAKNSKNKATRDSFMKQRKLYREEIRKLGGRSK